MQAVLAWEGGFLRHIAPKAHDGTTLNHTAPPLTAHYPPLIINASQTENKEKIKLNNQLPYLVANIVEVLDVAPEDDEEEDGAAVDLDAQRKGALPVLGGGVLL